MKKLLLLTIMGLLLKISFAQTVKHSWMVGGTALYNSKSYDKVVYENRVTAIKSRLFRINFSPDAGYFFSDRFVAGIKLLYAINKLKYLSATDFKPYKSTDYGVGPFVRYYFLPASKKINLLAEGSYLYVREKAKGSVYINGLPVYPVVTKNAGHAFSFAAGPVINFNSLTSLELLIGYTLSRYNNSWSNNNKVLAGLGI